MDLEASGVQRDAEITTQDGGTSIPKRRSVSGRSAFRRQREDGPATDGVPDIEEDPKVVSGDPKDELLWFLQMAGRLCMSSTFGWLAEARDYDLSFLQDDDPLRGAEGSKVDGGLYLGDLDLTARTYADKLDLLLRSTAQGFDLAGEDSKAPALILERGEMNLPALIVTIRTRAQNRNAAHFCVHFGGAPSMRILLPVEKDAQFEWQFGSFLSYHMPIPPRIAFLAFPEDRLQEARRNLKQVYKGEATNYVVPLNNIVLPSFTPNLLSDRTILRPLTAGNDSFEFLRTTIRASVFAQNLSITLDYSQAQPLDGDARLMRPHAELGPLVDKLELKDNLIRETSSVVIFSQPFGDEKTRIRHSPFHPLRCDNFVVLFGNDRNYVYWIPASEIKSAWWSDEEQVKISRVEIAKYRVCISGNADWFEQVYTTIVEPNAGSSRKKEERLRPHIQLDHYKVGRYVDDDDYVDVKYYQDSKGRKATKSKPDSPWWDVERANDQCARRGRGIWFPLGHRERIATAAFVAYDWDETDRSVYQSIGKLPADLHTGDLSPYTPCLLIKMLTAVTRRRHRNGFPSHVSGVKLDKGPHPCLYLIDCARPADRSIPRSKILVPEEFIDFEHRADKYTARMENKGIGGRYETAREIVTKLKWAQANPITEDTDLRELITVPFGELMVREYGDQLDAVESFLAGHENAVKDITWSSNLDLFASGTYVLTLGSLQQMFANEWSPSLKSAWWTGDMDGDGGDD